MLLFMSSPIWAGLISFAEYFFVETETRAEEFKEKFNLSCPRGFRCENAIEVEKNPNLAAVIDSASFTIDNVPEIDTEKILSAGEFFITDKRGERKNVRDKIKSLSWKDGKLFCVLSAGNSSLRADKFTAELENSFGFSAGDIVKTEAFINGVSVDAAISPIK